MQKVSFHGYLDFTYIFFNFFVSSRAAQKWIITHFNFINPPRRFQCTRQRVINTKTNSQNHSWGRWIIFALKKPLIFVLCLENQIFIWNCNLNYLYIFLWNREAIVRCSIFDIRTNEVWNGCYAF